MGWALPALKLQIRFPKCLFYILLKIQCPPQYFCEFPGKLCSKIQLQVCRKWRWRQGHIIRTWASTFITRRHCQHSFPERHPSPPPAIPLGHFCISYFHLTSFPVPQIALDPYHQNTNLASSNSYSKTELQVHFAYPNSRGSTEQKGLSFIRKPLWFERVISISYKTFAKHFPALTFCQSCFTLLTQVYSCVERTSMLTGPERTHFKVKDIF